MPEVFHSCCRNLQDPPSSVEMNSFCQLSTLLQMILVISFGSSFFFFCCEALVWAGWGSCFLVAFWNKTLHVFQLSKYFNYQNYGMRTTQLADPCQWLLLMTNRPWMNTSFLPASVAPLCCRTSASLNMQRPRVRGGKEWLWVKYSWWNRNQNNKEEIFLFCFAKWNVREEAIAILFMACEVAGCWWYPPRIL